MATKQKTEGKSIIVHQLNIRQVNRSSQDIRSWRNAITAAEGMMHNRTLLYDLYKDILLDGHLSSVLEKRVTAITNTPIVFGTDGKEDEKAMALIETETFTEMVAELLNSKFWGFTLMEMAPLPDNAVFNLINRKHVLPERGEVKINQTDQKGFSYKQPPYANYTFDAGKPDDLGLLMKAAQYVIYKRGGFGDWAQFAELFGMPFRKGTYDGYDPKTRDLLTRALDEIGSAPYVVIPKEADIEITANNSQGSKDTYSGLIESCNKEISKLIVGQTMTSEDGSSKSQSETHMKVQKEIHLADRLFITRILNHKLVPLMAKHGFSVANGRFAFKVDENIDPATKVDIDTKVAMQVPVGDDYWYETYGIPKPKNYKELKKQRDVQTHGRASQRDVQTHGRASQRDVQTHGRASQHSERSVIKRLAGFFQKAPKLRGGKTLEF